jgi:LPXTG-motif cell wall-anchored protein
VRVSGNGCAAGSTVEFSLDPGGLALGSTAADAAGAFDSSVTVPNNAALGANTVRATCDTRVLSASLNVTAAGAASARSGLALPRTGEDALRLASVGALLVVVGVAVVTTVRRRRLADA